MFINLIGFISYKILFFEWLSWPDLESGDLSFDLGCRKTFEGLQEKDPDLTRAYFWSAVYREQPWLWPEYFLTRQDKNWKKLAFLGKCFWLREGWPNPIRSEQPNITWPWSKKFARTCPYELAFQVFVEIRMPFMHIKIGNIFGGTTSFIHTKAQGCYYQFNIPEKGELL